MFKEVESRAPLIWTWKKMSTLTLFQGFVFLSNFMCLKIHYKNSWNGLCYCCFQYTLMCFHPFVLWALVVWLLWRTKFQEWTNCGNKLVVVVWNKIIHCLFSHHIWLHVKNVYDHYVPIIAPTPKRRQYY